MKIHLTSRPGDLENTSGSVRKKMNLDCSDRKINENEALLNKRQLEIVLKEFM